MNIRKILVMITLLTAAVFNIAAAGEEKPDASPELKNMLDSMGAFSAEFTQIIEKPNGTNSLASKGVIYLKRPDKMMMHTEDPDEQFLYTKNSSIYYYDPFVNQVTIFDSKKIDNSPFFLLVSENEDFWDKYTVTKEPFGYRLESKKKNEMLNMDIVMDGKDICSIRIVMKDGNTNVYKLKSLKQTVDDAVFNYTLPKEVEVDDQRSRN